MRYYFFKNRKASKICSSTFDLKFQSNVFKNFNNLDWLFIKNI